MGNIKMIKWDESCETSVIWQDMQHKGLFEYIQMANQAVIYKDHKKYRELLNYMKFYIAQHLSTEEQYMDILNDPDAETHLVEHDEFRVKIDNIIKHADEGEGESIRRQAETLLYELWSWYVGHIKKIDKKLGSFIRENNLY